MLLGKIDNEFQNYFNLHWIAIFIIYSFVAAIVLKFVIKFEI
ncbi:MAG: hypothetical protein ACE5EO_13035 [Candidatus Krumholzibacteriia bacterium]